MSNRWIAIATVTGITAAAYVRVVRPWQRSWGATAEEIATRLDGDDLVAEPARQSTRAITIDAPVSDVWPWVVQIGADRGGFYSYDWLENLFGLGIHSADRIVPEWQHRAVGDLVGADASGRGGWTVMDVRPDQLLVLKLADVTGARPVERTEPPYWEFLWTFALRPSPDGSTRLLVRERTGFDSILTKAAMSPIGLVSFVMTRKMLRGIKQRAERGALPVGRPVRA